MVRPIKSRYFWGCSLRSVIPSKASRPRPTSLQGENRGGEGRTEAGRREQEIAGGARRSKMIFDQRFLETISCLLSPFSRSLCLQPRRINASSTRTAVGAQDETQFAQIAHNQIELDFHPAFISSTASHHSHRPYHPTSSPTSQLLVPQKAQRKGN